VTAEPLQGRTDQNGVPLSAVAAETAAERAAQGLEPKIRSERALLQVARLVNDSTQEVDMTAVTPVGR
jgi:hypothetical protein